MAVPGLANEREEFNLSGHDGCGQADGGGREGAWDPGILCRSPSRREQGRT
ncbi:hypothetical protein chiPu_0027237, partial [Chiloscyllium punctatum]|nr:hypothetical protein [Chiloscyllium punctatum]